MGRNKTKPLGYSGDFEILKIQFVPTFIVLNQQGDEIGRVTETPKQSIEADLSQILNQP